MNNISKLYWGMFSLIFFIASSLIFKGYQGIGIVILLILGFSHIIVFHIAEKDFLGIRLKIKELIDSVIRMVAIAWKAKSMISILDIIIIDAVIVKIVAMAMYVIYLAITTIAIAIIACFFVIKKLYKPKLKTFQ